MDYEAAIANLIRTANDPSTPANVLAKLSQHRDSRVRRVAVRHLPANLELMEKITKDPSPSVREALAANRSIPFAIVKMLAVDPSMDVRVRICLNPMVPTSLIAGITDRKIPLNPRRWREAASEADTPACTLAQLALDLDVWTRIAVAKNKHTPAEVKQDVLAHDRAKRVRNAALASV